jgi:transcriptional regulator with XRE-family HTH domain
MVSVLNITGEQLRETRALLDWSQLALAVQFQISVRALAAFEAGEQNLPGDVLGAITRSLRAAGVDFASPGPRLKARDGSGEFEVFRSSSANPASRDSAAEKSFDRAVPGRSWVSACLRSFRRQQILRAPRQRGEGMRGRAT